MRQSLRHLVKPTSEGNRLHPMRIISGHNEVSVHTLEDGLTGKVSFVIGSQGHEIGSESVRVLSRLDQLREILAEEADPKTILAQAAGIAPGDEAGLDTALAFRLQQLASARTFATLFPVEERLQTRPAPNQVMYPSLLHFAADYNLRLFCAELLRFPAMVGAARAENRDGETPQQVAARKKFSQLESDLLQFSRRHGVTREAPRAAEDASEDMYVQPSSPRAPPPPAHRPAQSPTAGYVNAGVDSYITMNDLQAEKPDFLHRLRYKHRALSESSLFRKRFSSKKRNLQHQMSHIETGRPRAGREFPDRPTFRNDFDDDGRPIGYQNLESYRNDSGINMSSRAGSTRSSPRDHGSFDLPASGEDSPRTSAKKALKVMGITEEEMNRSISPELAKSPGKSKLKSPDNTKSAFPYAKSRLQDSEESTHTPERNRFFSNSAPKSYTSPVQAPDINLHRASYSSNCSLEQFEPPVQLPTKAPKSGKTSKIMKYLNIGRNKGKRSSSITEGESWQIKAAMSGRGRRGSESSVCTQTQEERDSGSYSDEEKEKPKVPVAKRSKNKAFKERDQLMVRRLSRRAQAAVNEKIETAPTLPSRAGRRRGAFKSFIDDTTY